VWLAVLSFPWTLACIVLKTRSWQVTSVARTQLTSSLLLSAQVVYTYAQGLQWCVQIADGLAFLHAQTPCIIHRDVKLENALLSKGESTLTTQRAFHKPRLSACSLLVGKEGASSPSLKTHKVHHLLLRGIVSSKVSLLLQALKASWRPSWQTSVYMPQLMHEITVRQPRTCKLCRLAFRSTAACNKRKVKNITLCGGVAIPARSMADCHTGRSTKPSL
jgi:serine/threonine protein kinase